MQGEAQVYIAAPPEEVFRLISDVTRTGEWSPECRRCHWIGESAGPVVGARFRGHNRRGWFRWAMQCRVIDVEPGRVFAFETTPSFPFKKRGSPDQVAVQAGSGGQRDGVEGILRVLWFVPIVVRLAFGGPAARQAQLETGVQDTLARIKAVAEAS